MNKVRTKLKINKTVDLYSLQKFGFVKDEKTLDFINYIRLYTLQPLEAKNLDNKINIAENKVPAVQIDHNTREIIIYQYMDKPTYYESFMKLQDYGLIDL